MYNVAEKKEELLKSYMHEDTLINYDRDYTKLDNPLFEMKYPEDYTDSYHRFLKFYRKCLDLEFNDAS